MVYLRLSAVSVGSGGRALLLGLILFCVFCFLPKLAWAAPSAYAQIPDYVSRGTFVQGACVSDDGRYAYVVKQRFSSYANLQRIDLKKKRSKRLSVSGGMSYLAHANGLSWVSANGRDYLLVAPSNKQRYLSVFVVDGLTAKFQGRIFFSEKVLGYVSGVAVISHSGTRVSAFVSSAGKLRRVSFDVASRKTVTGGTSIKGYSSCNQDISVAVRGGSTYLYGCYGGWKNSSAAIVKYRINGSCASKVWTKRISGECESAVPTSDYLYLAMEGSTIYNRRHDCVYSDRLVRWSM